MDILLKDILESNKKTELYKMAKGFGIEKISKLKKEELLQLVCTYLLNPDQMKKFLLNTGEQDFELFCRIAELNSIYLKLNCCGICEMHMINIRNICMNQECTYSVIDSRRNS